MANSYSIEIERLYTQKKLEDGDKVLYNVITRVDYKWVAKSPSGTVKSISFSRDLDKPTDFFREYSKIDKGEVMNWVNVDEERNATFPILDEQIEKEEQEKYVETGFPWNELSE